MTIEDVQPNVDDALRTKITVKDEAGNELGTIQIENLLSGAFSAEDFIFTDSPVA